jgi:hypothetical protein
MTAKALRVRFGTAKHGWLPISISASEAKFECTTSYTPKEFVLPLVEALIDLAQSRTPISRLVILSQEPIESEIRFFWTGPTDDSLSLQVVEFPDRIRTKYPGDIKFFITVNRCTILLSFWRALRDLESRVEQESFESHWGSLFPSKEMSLLTAAIEALQR